MKQPKTHNHNVPATPGEKTFDRLTYLGIGGVLNAVVSTVFFEQVQYAWKKLPEHKQDMHWGKRLKDTLDKWAQKGAKPFEPILGKSNIEVNTGSIKHFRRLVFGGIIGAGGWAVLAGIKPMEDNKEKLVNTFNVWHGYEPTAEQKESIRNEPKQTWGSLLGGRTVAFLTPILGAAPILDVYHNARGKEIFDDLTDLTRKPFNGALKMEKYIKMSPQMGWERTKNLYAEVFYTGLAITLLYYGSKFLSQRKEDSKGPAGLTKPLITGGAEFEPERRKQTVPSNTVSTDALLSQELKERKQERSA